MKKLFYLIILAVVLLTFFTLPCLAESAEELTFEVESAKDEATESEITLADRLTEFWNGYTAEILSGGGIATTLGLIIFLWKKIKPLLLKLQKAGDETADVQNKQSKAINGLIDTIDALYERITKIEDKLGTIRTNDERETKHFKEVQRSIADIAKILDTVYSHSKVLSQGTKGLVHTYCDACVKIAEREINGDAEVGENVKDN